jgi:hypothetical protein
MCRNDVRSGRLVRIMLDRQIPALEASATFFAGRYLPRKTKVFLDHVTEFLASDDIKLRDLPDAAPPLVKATGAKTTVSPPVHAIRMGRHNQSVAKNP